MMGQLKYAQLLDKKLINKDYKVNCPHFVEEKKIIKNQELSSLHYLIQESSNEIELRTQRTSFFFIKMLNKNKRTPGMTGTCNQKRQLLLLLKVAVNPSRIK